MPPATNWLVMADRRLGTPQGLGEVAGTILAPRSRSTSLGIWAVPMRLQLALDVTDLDAAIGFYGRMFDAEPARVRPGYANFVIGYPSLKLVLFEAVDDTECCYAATTETWVDGPDGLAWEYYVRAGDSEVLTNRVVGDGESACWAPASAEHLTPRPLVLTSAPRTGTARTGAARTRTARTGADRPQTGFRR